MGYVTQCDFLKHIMTLFSCIVDVFMEVVCATDFCYTNCLDADRISQSSCWGKLYRCLLMGDPHHQPSLINTPLGQLNGQYLCPIASLFEVGRGAEFQIIKVTWVVLVTLDQPQFPEGLQQLVEKLSCFQI